MSSKSLTLEEVLSEVKASVQQARDGDALSAAETLKRLQAWCVEHAPSLSDGQLEELRAVWSAATVAHEHQQQALKDALGEASVAGRAHEAYGLIR